MRTNQTKAQLRTLLKQIDADKSGHVNDEAFFQILKLHSVELTENEIAKLKKNCSRGGKLNYIEALQHINIDLDSALLREEKWTIAP